MLIQILLTLIALYVGITILGRGYWSTLSRKRKAAIAELGTTEGAEAVGTVDLEKETRDLPDPVRQYFYQALCDGQPMVKTVQLNQRGSFLLGGEQGGWRPFTATQKVECRKPGFLWSARIVILPGLGIRVHDAYIGGLGMLWVALAGLFPFLRLREKGELGRGELMRYLAEAPWYPTALLPSQGVRWEAVDEYSAYAYYSDQGHEIRMLFRFRDDHLIQSIYVPDRGMKSGDKMILHPWEGRWLSYRKWDGMTVPDQGEVAWISEGGPRPYWRGKIESFSFEYGESVS